MSVTQAGDRLDVAPGSVVVVRDEEWFVQATEETADGLLVRVQGLSELVRDTTATFYDALDDIVPLDPAKTTVVGDDSPRYRTARLWLESMLRKTPVPLGETSLSVATQGLADALSYQQLAVTKALDPGNLRPRILLADAVGLGKTLEIGMILSELVRRGRGERILIVTPRHVLEQMQREIWTRFALPFVRLDTSGIQRVRQKIPATRNPFTYFKRVIISIDTLKQEKYHASLKKQRWDAVVIDESHNLTNVGTKNNALARLLANNTEALILASATPHNGRADSFAELIRLLDPSAIPPGGELARKAVERLVIRRHRHSDEVNSEVGKDWAEREQPVNRLIPATPEEDAIASELANVWLWPEHGRSPYSGQNAALFAWVLAKEFLSSPAALRESIIQRLKRLGPADHVERQALVRLKELTEAALVKPSAKYGALVEHLKKVRVGKGSPTRVVVFAERLQTLYWLKDHLPKALGLPADAVDLMHGGLADHEQQRIVEAFKRAGAPVRVLVTGDVASEGVNLHPQCHELVHYDIPWSLIRIEQRNGRIDRYGQKESPKITALLLDPSSDKFSGDVRILAKLMEKEAEAHAALGDVASLMDRYDVKAEEDAIRSVLAGQRELDEVVRTVDEVMEGDDLMAMLVGMTDLESGEAEDARAGSGLYPDDISYLDEALHAAYIDPTAPPAKKGVGWRRMDDFGVAELVPPKDLAQRLEVLPQSYLADQRVTEKLRLATTLKQGKDRAEAALKEGSNSNWPDAHYLSPLHPVLDWASDRALARLERNQVFAVRGAVDFPTVLLLGTLTNRRGQVVAASWMTVQFPNPDSPEFALVVQHGSPAAALEALGWGHTRDNPGPVSVDGLQELIEPAVDRAQAEMRRVFATAEKDVARRVDAWSTRLDRWDEEADALIQRQDLKRRRLSVQQEKELVAGMKPDRQLVRPLLVIVPESPEGRAE